MRIWRALKAAAESGERLERLEETLRTVTRQTEELESDLDYLSHEFKRLRGTVTGGRRQAKDNGQIELQDLNAQIRAGKVPSGIPRLNR